MNKQLLYSLAVVIAATGITGQVWAAPPLAPSDLLAVPVYTDNDMRLTWTDNAGDEAGFRIERRTGATAFAPLDTVGPDVEVYTDTTAAADTEYFYQLRGYNADGDSANSNEASNRIAVAWPLSNGSHEMMNGWQDGTVNNLWGFHEGIDIQDNGSGGQTVVAARGGVIQRKDAGYAGGHFAVQVQDGVDDFFDRYLHVSITTAKVEGETVAPGESVATISTTAYADGRRHVHQALIDQWVAPNGYAANGSNFGNPFSIFDVVADQDPLGNTPGLEDIDGDGVTVLYKRPDDSYVTNGIVWGDVDISAEMTDNMGSSPRQNPQRTGYWIDATLAGASDLRSAATPYVLHDFEEWFGGPQNPSPRPDFDAVYDPDRATSGKRYHHLLTNTRGTDGTLANLDANQFWRTDARSGSGAEPNGSDFSVARENSEAQFPDGTYYVHVLMQDLLHAADNVSSVLVDNSRPYVKRVTVFSGARIVYQAQWRWDGGTAQLQLEPATFEAAAVFTALRTQDITIEMEFSEPMQTASISALTPSGGAAALGLAPTLSSTDPEDARTVWRALVSNLDIADDGSHDGSHMLTLDGTDLAGNALLQISGRGSMGANHHNRDAAGNLQGAAGTDIIHGFRIGPLAGEIPVTAIFLKQGSDDPAAPTVGDKASAIQTALNTYFSEVSYDEISFAVTGHGWYQLQHPLDWYETLPRTPLVDLVQEAITHAQSNGVAIADSDYLLVVTDEDTARDEWSTHGAWPYTVTHAPGWQLIAAGTLNLASSNPHITNLAGRMVGLIDLFAYPEVTVTRPFVGPWSHMSDKEHNVHVLGWEKWRAGWIDETGTATGKTLEYVDKPPVATPIVDQDYTISASDSDSDAVKMVAIEIGDRLHYTAEYRREQNLDTDLPDAGVLITKANEYINFGEGPAIIRESDVTAGDLSDAPFTTTAPRDVFDDVGSGVNISVLSTNANEAQIRLNYQVPATENDAFVDPHGGRWESEDIWIDAPDLAGNFAADPVSVKDDNELPVVGAVNKVYGRVRNQGHADASNFELHLDIRDPWGAGGPWRSLNVKTVPLLQGRDTNPAGDAYELIEGEWTPSGDPHACVHLTVLGVANDVNTDNNWTQENISQFDTTRDSPYAPVTSRFEVENPYDEPISVFFKLDGLPHSWSYTLSPERLSIPPRGVGSAQVTLQAHEAAPVCSSEKVTVSAHTPRVDTLKELGGITLQIGLKNPASVSAESWVQCGKPDPKLSERLSHLDPGFVPRECFIHTQGCTDPALPNTQVAIVYTLPDGSKDVRYVTTDESGCYIDTVTAPDPGRWETQVVIEGDECREDVSTPPQSVDVPPTLCGGSVACCWLWIAFLIGLIATLLWLARWRCDVPTARLPFIIAFAVTAVLAWLLMTRCTLILWLFWLSVALAIIVALLIMCLTSFVPCFGRRKTDQ